MKFNENLKKYREAAGLSRQDIADKIHMTANGYGLYETGRSEPKLDTLVKIAAALHVSLEDLLDYHPDEYEKAATLFHEVTGKTAVLDGDDVYIKGSPTWTRPIKRNTFITIMKSCEEDFYKMRPTLMKASVRNSLDLAYRAQYQESVFKGTPLEKAEGILRPKDLHYYMDQFQKATTEQERKDLEAELQSEINFQVKTLKEFEKAFPDEKKGPHSEE